MKTMTNSQRVIQIEGRAILDIGGRVSEDVDI
jgi:hypothetical protein